MPGAGLAETAKLAYAVRKPSSMSSFTFTSMPRLSTAIDEHREALLSRILFEEAGHALLTS